MSVCVRNRHRRSQFVRRGQLWESFSSKNSRSANERHLHKMTLSSKIFGSKKSTSCSGTENQRGDPRPYSRVHLRDGAGAENHRYRSLSATATHKTVGWLSSSISGRSAFKV